nr:hypothetical protein [uncultured Peptostreptococcus sp.]
MKSLLLLEDDITYRNTLSEILGKTYIVYQADTISEAVNILSMENLNAYIFMKI